MFRDPECGSNFSAQDIPQNFLFGLLFRSWPFAAAAAATAPLAFLSILLTTSSGRTAILWASQPPPAAASKPPLGSKTYTSSHASFCWDTLKERRRRRAQKRSAKTRKWTATWSQSILSPDPPFPFFLLPLFHVFVCCCFLLPWHDPVFVKGCIFFLLLQYLHLRPFYPWFLFFTCDRGTASRKKPNPISGQGGPNPISAGGGTVSRKDQTDFPP